MPRSEPIKAVRGVRDILPRDRLLWRATERAAAEVATRFAYQEIVTPIIERAELIERVGEDTDAVAKELYRFEVPLAEGPRSQPREPGDLGW